MDLIYVLLRISNVVWFLIPFRQYKNKYFYFFLLLTTADLLVAVFRHLIDMSSNAPFVAVSFLLVMALQKKDELKKYLAVELIISFIVLVAVIIINNRMYEIYIIALMQFLILYYVLLHFFEYSTKQHSFNLFYIALVFYQVLTVIKFVIILTHNFAGFFFVNISTFFLIIIGAFFCVFRPDSPKITFKFASKN